MRKRPAHLHQKLCSLLIALVLVGLPLPAYAVEQAAEQPTTETTTSSSASQVTQTQPTTSTPAATTAAPDLTLAQSTNKTVPNLQTTSSSTEAAPSVTLTDTSSETTDPNVSAKVENTVDSTAVSGNANVTENNTAGGAGTGQAEATATIVNVANTTGKPAGTFQTFTCNVTEDTEEDLVIDPALLLPICDKPSAAADPAAPKPVSGQMLQSGASLIDILNNIILSATSGNATVDSNGTAGDATTGDAIALANLVNIANTAITSKNSFLGVINIYANLKGDILVPQSFVDSLIGNTGAAGGNATSTTIANTINATATSGNATVANNDTAGNATTGDASTSLTILNLTGQEVIAKNSLLVFVNVLGKWMGMIVPAPGSKTAILGSGLQSSGQTLASEGDVESTIGITNNITVEAKSGDATVTNNDHAGNATTGRASAGVNLLNITDSNFFLEDWFGALFINVLGSWLGDFDIQANTLESPATPGAGPVQDVRVYQFTQPATVLPASKPTPRVAAITNTSTNPSSPSETNAPTGVVLGASTQLPNDTPVKHGIKLDIFALVAIVAALAMVAALGIAFIRYAWARYAAN